MVRHWGRLFALGIFIIFVFQPGNGFAAESKPSGIQNQVDITILHVDKFGVYGPRVVFYWDPAMGKQKIDALMKAAEQFRNKKAVITYASPSGDLTKDKRPILIDIAASTEEPKPLAGEQSRVLTREEGRTSAKEETKLSSREAPQSVQEAPDEALDDEAPPDEDMTSSEARSPAGSQEEGSRISKQDARLSSSTTSKGAPHIEDVPQDFGPGEEWPASKYSGKEKRRIAGETGMDIPSPQRPDSNAEQRLSPAYPDRMPAQRVARSTSISKDEVRSFIERVLRLNAIKDLNSVLWCYADQVNYYDRGVVNRDYIRRDLGYYYKNWDTISSSIDGDIVVIVTDQQDMRTVEFVSRYAVENARKSVAGKVQNIWKIKKVGNELKIVDQKQRILGSESR